MLAEQNREFAFTDRDFEFIRGLVTARTGISLGDHKRQLVYGRLSRRLRQLRLQSFAEYCDRLQADTDGELIELVNAITTNLTSFFREAHHFEYLRKKLLPALFECKARERRLRIWSAGCSTGEEPYSLAMVLAETVPPGCGWDVKVLATDIDSNVLATAAAGVYPFERVASLAEPRLKRWFQQGTGAQHGKVKVNAALQELIAFRELNLMETWPMRGPFDAVFCRNVVIYFDKPTQRALFARFADILTNDGHLFVGHSESLFQVSDRFELIGQTVYRKKCQPVAP